MLSPNVRVGVAAFILKSSKEPTDNPEFLVGKRLGSHGAGTLALPGGHLEFAETPEECAARELMEETGLEVTNIRYLTATNDHMPEDKKHYITLFMVCNRVNEADEPEVLEPKKCESWKWVSWKELNEWAKLQADPSESQVLEGKQNQVLEGKQDRVLERKQDQVLKIKLFIPLMNLVKQRPGVVPSLT